MPSNNSKYTPEIRQRIINDILESGKSATCVAKEFGINMNTVCRWVRDYRRFNQLPTFQQKKSQQAIDSRIEKKLTFRLRDKEKKIRELEEELNILKKFLHIFTQLH